MSRGKESYVYESEEESSSGSGVALLTRSSEASCRPRGSEKQKAKSGCPCHYRWINSKGALLVLLWNLLVFSYQYQALDSILHLISSYNNWQPWQKMSANMALEICLPLLLYPVAGWLADVKLGRYRAIKGSIWIMWINSLVLLCGSLFQYYLTYEEQEESKVSYLQILTVVVYIVNAIGLAGFQANIIPFGIDQMEGGGSEQYSSFVHWYYWTRNFSLGIILTIILNMAVYVCHIFPSKFQMSEHSANTKLIIIVSEVGFLSLALLIDFFFSHHLIKEPQAQNPFQTIFSVSLFIARHNRPVGRRSAMTYHRGYYSRSDLATVPYGGPFNVKDVETTKTFWRLIIFIASVSTAGIPIFIV